MNLLPSTSCLWVPVPCQVLAEVTTLQALQETTIDGLEIDMEGWCVFVGFLWVPFSVNFTW